MNKFVKWRVQWRSSPARKWINAGIFETRAEAREDAEWRRIGSYNENNWTEGVGFGNTRVINLTPTKGPTP